MKEKVMTQGVLHVTHLGLNDLPRLIRSLLEALI